ncbi:hypothetical protein [Nocardioides sp. BYT-33-1]|uniref:RCC1 domain-containing protein n=1 Tax=Nocardioides sp. BYT-33-1 TaxID=3416952 RepID=UPI003F533AAA
MNTQDLPIPLERGGSFFGWGKSGNVFDEPGQVLTPLAAVDGRALREVAMTNKTTLALTGDGQVVVAWGADGYTNLIPPGVASLDVVDLAAGSTTAGVVGADGKVVVWGRSDSALGAPTDVPAGLGGVAQLAIAIGSAFALKEDGSVVSWGRDGDIAGPTGVLAVPPGLQARAIAASGWNAFAVTTDGTVAGWGRWAGGPSLPPATQDPGNVTAVAAVLDGGVALLADGSIVGWGQYGSQLPPDLAGKRAVAITGGPGATYAVLDEDGVLHIGGGGLADPLWWEPFAEVVGEPVAQFSISGRRIAVIETALLRGRAPVVAGAAQVGSVLTGTPGTFSGEPDQVSSQWLADGQPIAGAAGASLTLTADLAGKVIAYRSTATKTGVEPVVSTSTPTAPVAVPVIPVPPPVHSTTTVGTVKVAKKAKKLTVSGQVQASGSSAGQAQVSIAKGKKTIITATVPVAADGSLTLVVKKFAKLVKKATKKAKYRGKYTIAIAYSGNAGVSASTGVGKVKIKK